MTIHRLALAFAGLLTLVLVAACGGGGGDAGGDDVTLDPGRATELARAALITPGDLPGAGWEVTEEDAFSDDDEPPFDSAACRTITTKMNAASAASEEHRAGRAQRAFAKEDPGAILPTEVDVSVNVFDEVASPKDTMKTFKEVLTSDDFEECFIDGLVESVATGDVTVQASVVKPSAQAPLDGEATAFKFHIEADGEELDMVLEFYVWRWGNAGVSLGLNGQDLPADLVKEIVATVDAKIQAAGG